MREVKLPNSVGILLPERELPLRLSEVRAVSEPNSVGKEPETPVPAVLRSMAVTRSGPMTSTDRTVGIVPT